MFTFVITPRLLIANSNSNPVPVPDTVYVGATRYPLPGSNKIASTTTPSTIESSIFACLKFAIPKRSSSALVSTVVSYTLVTDDGAGSCCVMFVKFLLSTINCCFNTLFTLSMYCFRASALFLNQLCLGLF